MSGNERREVACVVTDNEEHEDCRSITKLEYINPLTGRQQSATPEEVYADIVERGITYYVTVGVGKRARLVAVDGDDKQYVRTDRHRDSANDQLLKQPRC